MAEYKAVVNPTGTIDLVQVVDNLRTFLDKHPELEYRGMNTFKSEGKPIGRLVKHKDNIHI